MLVDNVGTIRLYLLSAFCGAIIGTAAATYVAGVTFVPIVAGFFLGSMVAAIICATCIIINKWRKGIET